MLVSRRQFVQSAAAMSCATLVGRARAQTPAALARFPPIYYYNGLITHRGDGNGRDGGDTAQREGWYWLAEWIRTYILHDTWPIARPETYEVVMNRLEPAKNGVFYRNPDLAPWNNPFSSELGFSRDQMMACVGAMAVHGDVERLRRLWNALPQDVLFGTKHSFNGRWIGPFGWHSIYTGDVVTPMTINAFRRAWNEDPAKASDGNGDSGDFELEKNVDIRIRAGSDKDNTGDDLNMIVMLILAALRHPSDRTRSATTRYARNRPLSYGSFLGAYREQYGYAAGVSTDEMRIRMDRGIAGGWQPDRASPALGAVRWYHRQESGGNPLLAELYAPLIQRYII